MIHRGQRDFNYHFRFFASARMVPICLSFLVFLPFELRMVPKGSPVFFSKVPTVQSLRVLRKIPIFFLSFSHHLRHSRIHHFLRHNEGK